MVILVVDVENSGKSADEIDKETVSFGEMQLRQEDRSCIHASNKLHLRQEEYSETWWNALENDVYCFDVIISLNGFCCS
ncbi:hypothetical protein Tco_0993526 [Tanacetum coccineum]